VAVAEDAEPESAPPGSHDVHPNAHDDESGDAVAAVVRDAKRLVDDLSHDVRQPLSSINMNVESAIRCLQLPEPRVASALEALTDCLAPESELLAMVDGVQHHLSTTLAESSWHPYARWSEEDPRYAKVAGALRAARMAIAGSILALARTRANASWCDPTIVRIETRRVSGRAQLRLCGMPCQSVQDIAFLRQCVATAARHFPGRVALQLGPNEAVIVISLPTRMAARRPIFVRGNHGA
jgi:hypothetical protein